MSLFCFNSSTENQYNLNLKFLHVNGSFNLLAKSKLLLHVAINCFSGYVSTNIFNIIQIFSIFCASSKTTRSKSLKLLKNLL
ncbi:hypothetical protein HOG21_07995 [bacterium]|nr:hypothetical protein [bacterium]